jgi:hypothetical protein
VKALSKIWILLWNIYTNFVSMFPMMFWVLDPNQEVTWNLA